MASEVSAPAKLLIAIESNVFAAVYHDGPNAERCSDSGTYRCANTMMRGPMSDMAEKIASMFCDNISEHVAVPMLNRAALLSKALSDFFDGIQVGVGKQLSKRRAVLIQPPDNTRVLDDPLVPS